MNTLPITKIKGNKKNPRLIKNAEYIKLLKSIKELDGMMQVNPLTLDIDNMIIAGNMRIKACKELGWKKVPVNIYTNEIHEESDAYKIYKKTYRQACDEITIKDNTHAGEWDYDILANEWADHDLNEYGLDLWETEPEEMKGLADNDDSFRRCPSCDQTIKD